MTYSETVRLAGLGKYKKKNDRILWYPVGLFLGPILDHSSGFVRAKQRKDSPF
jgi:hypothetical protein